MTCSKSAIMMDQILHWYTKTQKYHKLFISDTATVEDFHNKQIDKVTALSIILFLNDIIIHSLFAEETLHAQKQQKAETSKIYHKPQRMAWLNSTTIIVLAMVKGKVVPCLIN